MTISHRISLLLCKLRGPCMELNNHLRLGCQYFIITINPKTDNVVTQVLKPTQHFLLPGLTDETCLVVSKNVRVLKMFTSLKSGCSRNKHINQVSRPVFAFTQSQTLMCPRWTDSDAEMKLPRHLHVMWEQSPV